MKKILLLIVAFAGLLSCTKEDREILLVNQEEAIDRYITSKDGFDVVRHRGSNRVILERGLGADTLSAGDSVKFHYAGYLFSNGKGELFATNHPETAQAAHFELAGGLERRKLSQDSMLKGLAYGLVGAKAGEHCEIVFSAKYGFGNKAVFNVPKMSPLIFEVWIESIVKK